MPRATYGYFVTVHGGLWRGPPLLCGVGPAAAGPTPQGETAQATVRGNPLLLGRVSPNNPHNAPNGHEVLEANTEIKSVTAQL